MKRGAFKLRNPLVNGRHTVPHEWLRLLGWEEYVASVSQPYPAQHLKGVKHEKGNRDEVGKGSKKRKV